MYQIRAIIEQWIQLCYDEDVKMPWGILTPYIWSVESQIQQNGQWHVYRIRINPQVQFVGA